jgi:hypothetical protein
MHDTQHNVRRGKARRWFQPVFADFTMPDESFNFRKAASQMPA